MGNCRMKINKEEREGFLKRFIKKPFLIYKDNRKRGVWKGMGSKRKKNGKDICC
jgi:hypothetical protein